MNVIVQDQGARLSVVLAGPVLNEADRARLRLLTSKLLADYGRAFETISFNGEAIASTRTTSGGSGGRFTR